MPERLPNFLIIGAMRSGTTTLARLLAAHPDVFIPEEKEVHFFDQNFEKGVEWYRERFAGATIETAVGEATPTYLYIEEGPERMAKVVPEAKLVAILRNPIDRAYSHYWHERNLRREPLSFEEAVAAEPERLAATDPMGYRVAYLDRGRYMEQLRRVCEYFSPDTLLVLILEEFAQDPAGGYRSLCRALGVDPSFVPPEVDRRFNRYAAHRSVRLRELVRRLPGTAVRRLVGRLNIRAFEYPPMDPALRRRLIERFAADNDELAAWLGRSLSAWDR